MSEFGIMQYAASGMDAQRSALDVLARNVALTQTADRAHPVHPLVPQFAVMDADDVDADGGLDFNRLVPAASADTFDDGNAGDDGTDVPLAGQVTYVGAQPAARAVTGIDAVTEMVSVLGAQRSFEADASVFDAGKQLVQHTLEVENAP